MTLRDDMQPVVDSGRALAASLGLRPRVVVVRSRVWSGGKLGSGTATNTDLTISPAPKVREPPSRWASDAPGDYEAGDIDVEKISRTYAETAISPVAVAGTEVVYLVDGREYALLGTPAKLTFGWTLRLRRRTRA